MLKPTINILKEEVEALEPNKEYDTPEFEAKMCIKHERNQRGVERAMNQLLHAGIIKGNCYRFIRV